MAIISATQEAKVGSPLGLALGKILEAYLKNKLKQKRLGCGLSDRAFG
jgi:hypothetical protein